MRSKFKIEYEHTAYYGSQCLLMKFISKSKLRITAHKLYKGFCTTLSRSVYDNVGLMGGNTLERLYRIYRRFSLRRAVIL